MSKKLKAAVSHHDLEVAELRADRELAVEFLKAAMESLDNLITVQLVFLRFALWPRHMVWPWCGCL